VIDNTTEIQSKIDATDFAEHSNKISWLTRRRETENVLANANEKRSSIGFIDENLMEFRYALLLKKRSPMNEIINRKIGQLLQSGIIQHLEKNRFGAIKKIAAAAKDEENSQEDAEQLTMEHLGLCFFAVLIGLALSCFVFAIERLVGRCCSLCGFF
jgi:uncharacterized protein YqgQ